MVTFTEGARELIPPVMISTCPQIQEIRIGVFDNHYETVISILFHVYILVPIVNVLLDKI